MPAECGFREHDFKYSTANGSSSSSLAEIKCRRCGMRMTVKLQSSGMTVQSDVHIYPATGTNRISKEAVMYFISVVHENMADMKRSGYKLLDVKPTIHAITPPGPWL